uniref:Uncharacterized protein n=1 Tax=Knipowitschia caucasica TaxID=637954 RepID=A0AAV2M588_KNICA
MGGQATGTENRMKKEVLYRGERIYLDQDFTTKLQNQRKGYMRIRNHMKENGIKSHIRYPAKLLVIEDNGQKIYNTPQDAERAYGLTESAVAPERGAWIQQLQRTGWETVQRSKKN